jgi:hypothetical protein
MLEKLMALRSRLEEKAGNGLLVIFPLERDDVELVLISLEAMMSLIEFGNEIAREPL